MSEQALASSVTEQVPKILNGCHESRNKFFVHNGLWKTVENPKESKSMSRLGFALPAALCVACTAPPQPPQPRSATTVSATMGKTWDAVIDVFGEHNIPIKNMERVSGFISTDPLRGTVRDTANADCGKMLGTKVPPVLATYNVIVRGDSSTSTVRVNIRWTAGSPDPNAPARSVTVCSSTGVWESTFESRVKAIAESKL